MLVEKTRAAKDSKLFRRYDKLMRWADRLRRLEVRTNADTPLWSERDFMSWRLGCEIAAFLLGVCFVLSGVVW